MRRANAPQAFDLGGYISSSPVDLVVLIVLLQTLSDCIEAYVLLGR